MLQLAETAPRFDGPRPRELAMSAAWNGGLQRSLQLEDGRIVDLVFHGRWSHGFGPDFQGAMLDFGDGHLVSGDIEIHTRSSDWYAHGHHLDHHYNDVILHIVSQRDDACTRREHGGHVPVAVLDVPDAALFAIDARLPGVWEELGGTVCAADLSHRQPLLIRAAIHRLGDARLRERATTLQGELLELGDDAIFLRRLFEAFGYSENRTPFLTLAELVCRYDSLRRARAERDPLPSLSGELLGLGGFLPLSPTEAHIGGILPEDQYRIELAWQRSPAAFAADAVAGNHWQTGRVRPANHPVFRIMQLAPALIALGEAPAERLYEAVLDGRDLVAWLAEITARPWHPGLGAGRATAIVASVVLPIALARAELDGDADLEDAALARWAGLRQQEWTRPAKRALQQVSGGRSIRGLGERWHQGLIHLDKTLCAPRSCHACPIASAVITDNA